MENQYVLELNDISKEYYGNRVLKGVSLKVKPGEIHALLGENGAGKSTLMNVLFGMPVIHATGGFEGEVILDGKKVDIKSPNEAMKVGIGMVHQEFMLIPGFTITENIKLNRELTKKNFVSQVFHKKGLENLDIKEMNADAKISLDTLGMNIKPIVRIQTLPVGYMQFVEIAREIDKKNIKLLVFDEPTAVLTESEADNLLAAMKRLAAKGIGILFITHRLDEVMQAADSLSILRDGELVCYKETKDTSIIEIAELMVGRKIEMTHQEDIQNYDQKKTALEIKNLRVDMPGEEVKGISLQVKEGEILGIGGLAGQGKIGIANGIMGLYPAQGELYLYDEKLPLNHTGQVLKKGLAFVSEDRRGVGLLLDTSIEMNIVTTAMQTHEDYLKRIGPFSQQDTKRIRSHANRMIEDLDIRCTGPWQLTRRLSGGNQQKVCVARALALNPKVLLVSEPTRGIDIGAKKLLLDLLVKLNKEKGMTIVMTSSELAELRTICNRIAIITEGKLEGILLPTDSDADFGLMMSGDYSKVKNKEAR